MLNPKSTGFLNAEMSFQSGSINRQELLDVFHDCSIDQEKIAKFTKLTKHMSTPMLNEMAKRLCDIEAEENSRQPLRTDNLARAIVRNQFERLLGNDKQKFLEEVLQMSKQNTPAITFPIINSNHLKELFPTINKLIKSALNVAAKEAEPIQKELDEIINRIKNDKPEDKELEQLIRKRFDLLTRIDNINKAAISDLISFNIIKPYIVSQIKKDDIQTQSAVLKKKVALDSTLITQLYENYNKLQQELVKKEEQRALKPPPSPESTIARQSLKR